MLRHVTLQAWAFVVNHYHLVIGFENNATPHRDFKQDLHRELAVRLNRIDATPGRQSCTDFGILV
jgi:hypothetical protein